MSSRQSRSVLEGRISVLTDSLEYERERRLALGNQITNLLAFLENLETLEPGLTKYRYQPGRGWAVEETAKAAEFRKTEALAEKYSPRNVEGKKTP